MSKLDFIEASVSSDADALEVGTAAVGVDCPGVLVKGIVDLGQPITVDHDSRTSFMIDERQPGLLQLAKGLSQAAEEREYRNDIGVRKAVHNAKVATPHHDGSLMSRLPKIWIPRDTGLRFYGLKLSAIADAPDFDDMAHVDPEASDAVVFRGHTDIPHRYRPTWHGVDTIDPDAKNIFREVLTIVY